MALSRSVSLAVTYGDTNGTKGNLESGDLSASAAGVTAVEKYTVVQGDTLWRIAKLYLGSGKRYPEIYNANVEIIEKTARAHGKKNSANGHWIWAGTELSIPVSEGTEGNEQHVSTISNPLLGKKIAESATAFSYTDVASGQSDSISITVHDVDKSWLGRHKPQKGAQIGIKVNLANWNSTGIVEDFDCGSFIADDISFSGRPLNCVIGGVSVPADDDFKTRKRTNTWEKTTVCDIASKIAHAAGVSLHYDADTIRICETEQNNQTDSAFLYGLCEKYGLGMKVYNYKIVIFDIGRYEEKKEVRTIKEEDMLSWSCSETLDGTYTGVELSYTDPDAEDSIHVVMGSEGRMYTLNVQASGRYDAELQAAAKINSTNRKICTMKVTIKADTRIVATQCIGISGLGSLDGKYYVDEIRHSIDTSGYRMQLSLHRVQALVRTAVSSQNGTGGNRYVVKNGDTLWGISKRFYGTGKKHGVIYNANAAVIESVAKAHGKRSSESGHWIWAGTELFIPEG